MASEGLHEPAELLDEATVDRHRATGPSSRFARSSRRSTGTTSG